MKRLVSYNVYEGDPNLIKEGQILMVRDSNNSKKILDIKQRFNGVLKSLITPEYDFVITTIPVDTIVTMNGATTRSIEVKEGTVVNWKIWREGYKDQSGTDIITSDTTKTITLEHT